VTKRSSSVKKRKSDKPSESTDVVPFGLPFGDDETVASRNSKNSKNSKTSKKKKEPKAKSPTRKSKRLLKVDVKGYENEISDLQNQVMRLQEETYQEETEASKQLQDFKRKALDAKLELQRSQLENREVRSDLRDKTSALKEAELDILDLEKRLREKANEVFLLEDEVETVHHTIGEKIRTQKSYETDDTKSSDIDEVSIGGMEEKLRASLKEKDAKIESLEKEMQRLENGGGPKDGEASLDDVFALKRDLRASHAEAQAMKSKYEGSQERNVTLDDEVQHWKTQSFSMEDELAEVRTQLNYWMAKYEDVVGASDSAKAQLSTPTERPQFGHAQSLKDISRLDTFTSEQGTYALDGSFTREEQATEVRGIGGLWKKLTTPAGSPKQTLNASNIPVKQLSSTLH
jgi:chromosome segregation ATPase